MNKNGPRAGDKFQGPTDPRPETGEQCSAMSQSLLPTMALLLALVTSRAELGWLPITVVLSHLSQAKT